MAEVVVKEAAEKDPTGTHRHLKMEEAWYVVEGELEFVVDEKMSVATAGSFVMVPRNAWHSYRVAKAPARYLMFFSPAGYEENFKEGAALGPVSSDPDYIKARIALAQKYGTENDYTLGKMG